MTELRRSPLHDRHVDLGAKLADFGGWEMPIEYSATGGGVIAEHTAVRTAVGIFDVSHLGKATVAGPGAREFVNSCLTADLGKIAPGQAQYTLCCAADGGVIDDVFSYLVGDDEVFLMPNAANAEQVIGLLAAAAPDGVTVTDQHQDFAVLAVQGPQVGGGAAGAGPARRPGLRQLRRRRLRRPAGAGLPHRLHRRARLRADPVLGRRRRRCGTPWPRPPGAWVACRPGSAPATPCAPRWATRCTGRT